MRNIPLPSSRTMIHEMMSWIEFPLTLAQLPNLLSQERGAGRRVIVLPGFGAGDLSTAPLRQYLSSLGHSVRGWSQGTNNGEVNELIDQMRERVEQESGQVDDKVVLIGWSLGGYIAREVARDIPHCVSSVVTMGSPVVGGPKYTHAAAVFSQRGMDLNEIERIVDARYDVPLTVPVTAIYSRNDGVVAWQACIDQLSPNVEHVEVSASHIGLGFSAETYRTIARHLAA